MAFTMLPYVWANGGDVLSSSGDKVTPTLSPNPQLESALTLYRSTRLVASPPGARSLRLTVSATACACAWVASSRNSGRGRGPCSAAE